MCQFKAPAINISIVLDEMYVQAVFHCDTLTAAVLLRILASLSFLFWFCTMHNSLTAQYLAAKVP